MVKMQTLNIVENTARRTQHQGNIDHYRPTHLVVQIRIHREANELESNTTLENSITHYDHYNQ